MPLSANSLFCASHKNQITIIVLFFIVNISTFVNFFQKLWPIPSTVPGYLKAFFLAYTSQKLDNIHRETRFACSCIPSSLSQKIQLFHLGIGVNTHIQFTQYCPSSLVSRQIYHVLTLLLKPYIIGSRVYCLHPPNMKSTCWL